MNGPREDLGTAVRRWRKAKGLTQARLAEGAGISTRHMSFIETGRSTPSREVLLRLTEVLGLPRRDRDLLLEEAGHARVHMVAEPAPLRLLSSPEEIKALADPLRLDLLRAFGDEPRTAKSAARLLGVPPSRVYHHVDVLEAAGLIDLVETRPRRGAVEKYYRAVASAFRLAPELRGEGEVPGSACASALEVLDAALDDLRLGTSGSKAGAGEIFAVRGVLRLSRRDLDDLVGEIQAVLKRYHAAPGEGRREYGLTLVGIPRPRS